ncbi:MAG: hypothetical protein V4591_11055 [Bdellovibrionota bacterium]
MLSQMLKKIGLVGASMATLTALLVGCSANQGNLSGGGSPGTGGVVAAVPANIVWDAASKSVTITSPVAWGYSTGCTQSQSGGTTPVPITSLMFAPGASGEDASNCKVIITKILATVAGSASPQTYAASTNLTTPISSNSGNQATFTLASNPNLYANSKMAWNSANNVWNITISYSEDATLLPASGGSSGQTQTGTVVTAMAGPGVNGVPNPDYTTTGLTGSLYLDSNGYILGSSTAKLPLTPGSQTAEFGTLFPSYAAPSAFGSCAAGAISFNAATPTVGGVPSPTLAGTYSCFVNAFCGTGSVMNSGGVTSCVVNPIFVSGGALKTITTANTTANYQTTDASAANYQGPLSGSLMPLVLVAPTTALNIPSYYASNSMGDNWNLFQAVNGTSPCGNWNSSSLIYSSSSGSGTANAGTVSGTGVTAKCLSTTPAGNTKQGNSAAWYLPYTLSAAQTTAAPVYYTEILVHVDVSTSYVVPTFEVVQIGVVHP